MEREGKPIISCTLPTVSSIKTDRFMLRRAKKRWKLGYFKMKFFFWMRTWVNVRKMLVLGNFLKWKCFFWIWALKKALLGCLASYFLQKLCHHVVCSETCSLECRCVSAYSLCLPSFQRIFCLSFGYGMQTCVTILSHCELKNLKSKQKKNFKQNFKETVYDIENC